MSTSSSAVVPNDSGFSGTGSPSSPPMSPTNGFPGDPSQQKENLPPPMVDIPNNNNNTHKDEDELWPPPPPPDASKRRIPPPPPPPKPKGGVAAPQPAPKPGAPTRKIIPPPRSFGFKPFKPYTPEPAPGIWSPSSEGTPGDVAPPPPAFGSPSDNKPDSAIKPVWSPYGDTSKKEFKPVKPDLKPRTSVSKPTYTAPAVSHSWSPQPAPTSPHQRAPTSPYSPASTAPPLSPTQPIHATPSSYQYAPPPPPPAPLSPLSPGGRTPASPAGVTSPTGPGHFAELSNGYGFIPTSAISGSPSDLQTDPSQLPPGALFQKQTIEGDVVHTDTYYPVQQVTRTSSKVTRHEAPRYEGIGPRDKDGMPLGLRQHVKDENRHDWYKEMFKTIHKGDEAEDTSVKPHKYPHEIENDSKDKWGNISGNRQEPTTVVHNTPAYRVQPGKITDFQPGKSALAEHERKMQEQREVPTPVRRVSAPGPGGYGSDEEAKKAYRNFIRSGELPREGLGKGAPTTRRDKPSGPPLPPSSSLPPPSSTTTTTTSSSPALPSPVSSTASFSAKSASLPRTGLPKMKTRLSEGSGLSAAERLGIKSPPPARTTASTATSKPTTTATDNRYNYVPTNQPTPAERARQERLQEEKRKRDGPQPDASYSRSLPEYNPVKSPNINDDELDDFDFSPPVRVPQAKQEVLPKVERSVSLEKKITKASAVALYPFNAQNTKELSFKKGDTIYLTRDVDKNWFEGEHHGNKGIFPKSYVEVVTSIEEARSLMLDTPSMEGKAKAKYKFKGETANELSINKSEIIDLIRKVDANWWEARVGTRHGIVPVAYVDVLREPQAGVTSPQLSPGGFGKSATSPSPKSPKSPSYQPQSKNPIGYSSTLPSPSSANRSPANQTLPSYGGLSGRGDDPRRPAQNAGYHQRPSEPSKQFSTGIQERFRAVYSYQPNNDDELELMEGDMVTVMEKCDDGWFVGFSESTGLFGTFPGNYVEKI